MKLVKTLGLLFCLALLAGCASQSLLEKYRNQSAHQIFTGGEKAMADGDMNEASEHFEALQALYPFGEYARQGQLDIIYVYYKNGDYASTEAAAQRYLHLYPLGPNADYALYMQGLAEFTQTSSFFGKYFDIDRSTRSLASYKRGFVNFVRLIQQYPSSLYAADARKRLIYFRNLYAMYFTNVANYYYSRKAYVASAQAAANVVMHLQGTPAVPQALEIMLKSYRQLGLTEQANDVLAIIKLNYPKIYSELKGD
jgi:outer membrane protein assembly factor BamD